MRSQQFDRATKAFHACIETRSHPVHSPINPDILKAAPHHCLGLCLKQLGRTDEALQAFRRALEAEPSSRGARMDAARLLYAQNEPLEALTCLHALITENSDDSAAWALGAEIALARPEFLEFALDWTGEAIRHLPRDPVVAAHRAEALLLSGNVAAAFELWNQSSHSRGPQERAAVCMCELLGGDRTPQESVLAHEEAAVSREFLKWYQRLVHSNARTLLSDINQRLPELARVLPTASRTLEAAIAEAGSPATS
jgi:tetratricopeptide (TPR) repeat protein